MNKVLKRQDRFLCSEELQTIEKNDFAYVAQFKQNCTFCRNEGEGVQHTENQQRVQVSGAVMLMLYWKNVYLKDTKREKT